MRLSDVMDLSGIEGDALSGAEPSTVQDFGNFWVAVVVQELIDFGDDLRLDFTDIGDGQRPGKQESARGATGQTDLGSDHRLPFEQGYILDEQT